ncbi:cryptochrome/photolyase family protein [Nakamurella deserti]|uniref:cryptochrome/photolyase family protein n=1 Tax=Nakamurella deserti TaxID=2164074 RepID=UPI000DBE50B1|nr:deoxyribodipyrimidine photo-lyase [Nakamurella deserti]
MTDSPALLWFRRDLRLDDHPALLAAASGGRRVLGLFVLDPVLLAGSGEPRIHFLHSCLQALSASTEGRLLVVRGDPRTVVPAVARQVGAAEVHISADFMPYGHRRDEAVRAALGDIPLIATGSPYAVAPGRVSKGAGGNYAVYTPFFRAWSEHGYRGPAGPGNTVDFVPGGGVEVADRVDVGELAGVSEQDPELPPGGEAQARQRWATFRDERLADYKTERDRPDRAGTSRLSAYLKYGCIHPRTLLADIKEHPSEGAVTYRQELAWRDFYADLVWHNPRSAWHSIDPAVDALQYDSGPVADEHLTAWQTGRTGYPYIDAAMRQLLAEGWIHNRARMGVASFLIKDLHLPWQVGAKHFMRHLVDGDLPSNNHGWQWAAGAGPHAAPFYRVFQPVTQGVRHDPDGDYVRRYVPELRGVAGKAVHTPWELPDGVPDGYPERIVDHAAERLEALRRWEQRPKSA